MILNNYRAMRFMHDGMGDEFDVQRQDVRLAAEELKDARRGTDTAAVEAAQQKLADAIPDATVHLVPGGDHGAVVMSTRAYIPQILAAAKSVERRIRAR